MTDKCRYAVKKKNILKGYYWCNRWRKVHKNCNCKKWCYKPKFPKSLFIWIKELFVYGW